MTINHAELFGLMAAITQSHDIDLTELKKRADELVNACDENHGECGQCGEICCPHGDIMHFHHDGCPSCAEFEQ